MPVQFNRDAQSFSSVSSVRERHFTRNILFHNKEYIMHKSDEMAICATREINST